MACRDLPIVSERSGVLWTDDQQDCDTRGALGLQIPERCRRTRRDPHNTCVPCRQPSRWVVTVGRYLQVWGLSPQRRVRRAYERNEAAIAAWLKREYPAIARRAKREKAVIYWGDEMGLRSDHVTGTSYAPVGQTPVVRATGSRFGCNMISAITNKGALAFMVFQGKFKAGSGADKRTWCE